MPELVFLGTAAALPDPDRENTHLCLVGDSSLILVDCAGQPLQRLQHAGLDPLNLTDVILTHFHPDHVYGMPALLLGLWLLGYRDTLHIYGLTDCLTRLQALLNLFEWRNWPNFYPVEFCAVPETELALVLRNNDFEIYATPGKHHIPVIGLRIETRATQRITVYSSDTEPCPAITRLATGADLLIHEATGASVGHSSAVQAGTVATIARVGELALIHYHLFTQTTTDLLRAAQSSFDRQVWLATDFAKIPL